MITADADWIYFETEEESAHFDPIRLGDEYWSNAVRAYRRFFTTVGDRYSGSQKRRRPLSYCTPEQLALAGISNEPTYEHYL